MFTANVERAGERCERAAPFVRNVVARVTG
jgi:hypothetical protein